MRATVLSVIMGLSLVQQVSTQLAERSHHNVAVIALANKTARMAWAMLRHHTDYQPERAAA
jgi:transposase